MSPRFGLAVDMGHFDTSVAQGLDDLMPVIAAAEAAGIESVWLGESYPTSAEDPGGFHLSSPLLVAAALAERTSLRFGTGVSLLQAWHPLRFAYDVAVADQLTRGRLAVGLGLGPSDLRARFDGPRGPRGAVFEEQVAFLRAMWRGEEHFDGRFFSTSAGIWPRPLQVPSPALLIGGGVQASARRAARLGDGYYASSGYDLALVSGQARTYHTEVTRRHAASEADDGHADTGPAAARGDSGSVIVNRITVIEEDAAALDPLVDRHVAPLISAYASFGTVRLGDAPAGADRTGDLALLGTPDQLVEQLLRYLLAGVTGVQFRVSPGGLPIRHAVRTVELLGREVLPRVRARLEP